MARPNYFFILEGLSQKVCEAIELACRCEREHRENNRKALLNLRCDCDKMVCELENSLFCDFIPPLERDNIAALAHSFLRIISRAVEHECTAVGKAQGSVSSEEERLCIELAKKLSENTALLKKIRNPQSTPSLTEFRALLRRASDAHNAYISKINEGSIPRTCALVAFSSARLRREIARCFDELVEIMLGNI